MKYVRTKDGRIYQIYDKVFEYKGDKRYQLVDSRFEISLNDIVKQADTIEELCDEFVIADVEHKCWERVFKPALESVLKDYEKPYEIYGAIWTDKGLIYVAKLNDKGELELL